MQLPLVATKLRIPPVQRDLVPRVRLIERLNQGLESRLILVSTPAGYGKTMLLSAWAGQAGLPVSWISLDESDNDPVRFLSYLAAAVAKVVPGADRETQSLVKAPQAAQVQAHEMLLATLLNDIAAAEPFILVLDDYHLVKAPAIHNMLIYILSHLPAQLHLVIAARADPPLGLARLRAHSQLTELRLADLCFTREEAALFCNQGMNLGLPEEQVTALTERTEGWIAGLQMAAVSLRGAANKPERIRSFSGSNRFILDYLVEEVLKGQPETVQSFLLKTSIFERLSGPACDAVTGLTNSQEMLQRLESENLFIIGLDEERSVYRYHQLFLDLLRKQAQRRFAGELADLHRRAWRWFEQKGDLESAIHHALLAGDIETAAGLVERAAQPFLMRSEIYTFQSWIQQLPEEVLHRRPNLLLFNAWVMALGGDAVEAIENQLRWVETGSEGSSARVNVIRGYLQFSHGEIPAAARTIEQAKAELPAGEELFRGIAEYLLSLAQVMAGRFDSANQMLNNVVQAGLQKGQLMLAASALCNLAEVHFRLGRLQAARDDFERVLVTTRIDNGRRLPIAAKAFTGLGEIRREWNELEQAESDCMTGIELARYLREGVAVAGYITLARIRQARGDSAGAQAAFESAWTFSQKTPGTIIDDLYVKMYRARLNLLRGDLGAVERWIQERNLGRGIEPADLDQQDDFYKFHLLKYELLILARWLIATHRPQEALGWLAVLREKMESQGRIHLLIEVLLVSALANQQMSAPEQAAATFDRALALAEAGGYVRLFLDEGPAVRVLLQRAAQAGVAREYAQRLLAAMDLETKAGEDKALPQHIRPPQTGGMVEALTSREIELLAMVAAGLNNQAIAEKLFISLPTVKWHTGNIFGKLGVRSRTQAVAKARELGILPEH